MAGLRSSRRLTPPLSSKRWVLAGVATWPREPGRAICAVLAGKAKFTPQEQAGYDLFRGKAQCNSCHRDGGPGEDPLFTDFTASNIGTPANPRLPYYAEGQPDQLGYVANPAGYSFVDGGVGAFLAKGHVLSQPSAVDARWAPLASANQARIQVPTLRNVDKRPNPDFVKAYTHNGYFTSLKAIVHFYNTRDLLPRCQPHAMAPLNAASTAGRYGATEPGRTARAAHAGYPAAHVREACAASGT